MSYEPQPTRVLIATKCQRIPSLLGSDRKIRVVGVTADESALFTLTNQLQPHVLLIDFSMVEHSEFEKALKRCPSPPRLVMMQSTLDRSRVVEALRLGATGIVLTTTSPADLLHCIHTVRNGKYSITSEIIDVIVTVLREALPNGSNGAIPGKFALTARELDIIAKIGAGLSNRQVCQEFSISERTVKHHLTRIFSKVGVTNRLALALFAINNRLVDTPTHLLNQQPPPNHTNQQRFSNGSAHK